MSNSLKDDIGSCRTSSRKGDIWIPWHVDSDRIAPRWDENIWHRAADGADSQ